MDPFRLCLRGLQKELNYKLQRFTKLGAILLLFHSFGQSKVIPDLRERKINYTSRGEASTHVGMGGFAGDHLSI